MDLPMRIAVRPAANVARTISRFRRWRGPGSNQNHQRAAIKGSPLMSQLLERWLITVSNDSDRRMNWFSARRMRESKLFIAVFSSRARCPAPRYDRRAGAGFLALRPGPLEARIVRAAT